MGFMEVTEENVNRGAGYWRTLSALQVSSIVFGFI